MNTMHDFVKYFNEVSKVEYNSKELHLLSIPNAGRILPTLRFYGYIDDENNVKKTGLSVKLLVSLIRERRLSISGNRPIFRKVKNEKSAYFFENLKIGDKIPSRVEDAIKLNIPYYTTFALFMRQKGYVDKYDNVIRTIDLERYMKESNAFCEERYRRPLNSNRTLKIKEQSKTSPENIDPVFDALSVITSVKLNENQLKQLIEVIRKHGVTVSATKTIEF